MSANIVHDLEDTVASPASADTQQSDMRLHQFPIIHVVLFQFKNGTSEEVMLAASKRMLALKHKAVLPDTRRPYIVRSSGGRDNSPEGLQAGLTHGFVVEFKCASDRDYYVNDDPAHKAFKASIGDIVEKALVFDYSPNVFRL